MGGREMGSPRSKRARLWRSRRLRVVFVAVVYAIALGSRVAALSDPLPEPLRPIDVFAVATLGLWICSFLVARKRKAWRYAELVLWCVVVVASLSALPPTTFSWMGNIQKQSLLQVILNTARDFAWPIAVIVAVSLLRTPISALIGRIENFEGLGATVSFAKSAESFREDAATIAEDAAGEDELRNAVPDTRLSPDEQRNRPETSQSDAAGTSGLQSHTTDVAERWAAENPPLSTLGQRNSAEDERNALLREILDTWSALEAEAAEALQQLPAEFFEGRAMPRGPSAIRQGFRFLIDRGFLPRNSVDVLRRAQILRNRLVHEGVGQFSTTSLRDLLEGTLDLRLTLRSAMERYHRSISDDRG